MKVFKLICFMLAIIVVINLISCKATTINEKEESSASIANFTFNSSFAFYSSNESKNFVKKLVKQLSQRGFENNSVIIKSIPITFLSQKNLNCYKKNKMSCVYIQTNSTQKIITIISFINKKDVKIIEEILNKVSNKYPKSKRINENSMHIEFSAFGNSFKGKVISCYNQDSKKPCLENITIIIPVNSVTLADSQHIWVENIHCSPSIARKLEIKNNNDESKTIVQPLYITYDSFKKTRKETLADSKNFLFNYKVKITKRSVGVSHAK